MNKKTTQKKQHKKKEKNTLFFLKIESQPSTSDMYHTTDTMASNFSDNSDGEYESEPEIYRRRFSVDYDYDEIDEYVAALQRGCGRVLHYEPEDEPVPASTPAPVIRESLFPSARMRMGRKTLILPAITRCVAIMRKRRTMKN